MIITISVILNSLSLLFILGIIYFNSKRIKRLERKTESIQRTDTE